MTTWDELAEILIGLSDEQPDDLLGFPIRVARKASRRRIGSGWPRRLPCSPKTCIPDSATMSNSPLGHCPTRPAARHDGHLLWSRQPNSSAHSRQLCIWTAPRPLRIFRVAPGESGQIPLLTGTASFTSRLGYTVPPGSWGIQATLILGPDPRDPARRRTPVLRLTITA